jgi:glycosyltransferase involved in cell wall biosynthesis
MRLQSIPQLSVVVPVYNGGTQFTQCLDALLASDFQDREIVVVDDNSTDASAEVARAFGVEVIRLASRRGPAAARNCGAAHARGQVILFVDADVVVRRDTLARVAAFFREQANVAALFGSYDDEPAAENFVSQYKNLLHHFTHQRSSAQAATFWAGCGAVRREAFKAVGGFDESKYRGPSIEDIELGHRLSRARFRITLDHELQVKHLKRWTLVSLLRTDILSRALPWSRLIMEESGMINELNLRFPERACAMLAGLAAVLLILSYFQPLLLIAALAAAAAIWLINFQLQCFLKERRGLWFALKAFAMLLLYYLYSGVTFTLVYVSRVLKNAVGVARLAEPGRMNDD